MKRKKPKIKLCSLAVCPLPNCSGWMIFQRGWGWLHFHPQAEPDADPKDPTPGNR